MRDVLRFDCFSAWFSTPPLTPYTCPARKYDSSRRDVSPTLSEERQAGGGALGSKGVSSPWDWGRAGMATETRRTSDRGTR